ncbi:actin-binding Rho-activating protein [Conger conger]|uniref:actin-binding Rho-activating protein n=1 Tax=Conger conger TaxID=82655 RepID=UPI002A5AEFC2|nr:actin-binding Rho-activating protein [Conger conger]
MATAAAPDSRPGAKAIRRFRCAVMVTGLAKSWQTWATKNSERQESVPAGWVPDSVQEDVNKEKRVRSEVKHAVKARAVEADGGEDGCGIRTGAVTRTVEPVRSACASGVVGAVKEKIDGGHLGSEEVKPFLGGESPTRRRHCSSKASGGLRAWAQLGKEVRRMGSRSSSLDTEDSGLGEEAGLSDNSEEQESPRKSRPKIRVSSMGDLKAKWAQWSQQHIDGQKLNPFSEEFDYDLAMSQRLQKGDEGYGKPKEGTKTAERGERAQRHIRREMDDMCYIIRDMGRVGEDGRICMTFGRLFGRYVKISDKVVGILLRCRKHGMLDFPGEMLWQGQDDDIIITLLD